MSALAPVVREKRCSRSSKHQADLVVSAAKCRTEQSLMVSHFRRNYGTKLRLVSLKTRLVAAFCCILAFSAVAMAGPEQDGKQTGFFKRFCKTIGGDLNLWSIAKTVLVLLALALALVAMFGDFTMYDPDFGKNLFADEGSSMWLRLAFVIPGLVLFTGSLSTALVRTYQRKNLNLDTAEEYEAWKRGDEYAKLNMEVSAKYVKKLGMHRTSAKLLLAWFIGIIVLAIVTMEYGSIGNAGDEMFQWTSGVLMAFGAIGTLATSSYIAYRICKDPQLVKTLAEAANDKAPPSKPGQTSGLETDTRNTLNNHNKESTSDSDSDGKRSYTDTSTRINRRLAALLNC